MDLKSKIYERSLNRVYTSGVNLGTFEVYIYVGTGMDGHLESQASTTASLYCT